MNYKKLVLVGFISAFVAVLTSVMGVAGTIIGSVISSVLYNMLTEALDKPINKTSFSADFEWDIAYVFPLVVIAFIQLLLIFALLAELGILPSTFLNVYLSLQNFADNNLYRLLGIALLIISAYPIVLKPEFVKKEHGLIIAGVGLVFLARGFVDLGNRITSIYDTVFIHFDLPIAVIAFILLVFVIVRILNSARNSQRDFKAPMQSGDIYTENHIQKSYNAPKQQNGGYAPKREDIQVKRVRRVNNHRQNPHNNTNHNVNKPAGGQKPRKSINESSGNIQFESNDLLDEYKK